MNRCRKPLIQCAFLIKVLETIGLEEICFIQHNECCTWQTGSKFHPNWWETSSIPFFSGAKQKCHLSTLLFNTVYKAQAGVIRAKIKENNFYVYFFFKKKSQIILICRWSTIHKRSQRVYQVTCRNDWQVQQSSRIQDQILKSLVFYAPPTNTLNKKRPRENSNL